MAESVGGKPEERRLLRILPASASQDPSLSNVELKAEEKFVDLKFSAHPSNSSFNLHIYDTDCVTPKDNCVYIAQNRRPNLVGRLLALLEELF